MKYAVSDLHGRYDKYKALIKMLDKNDTLYILGDVIDRGPDGFRILLDMAQRPNVVGLMGNHEDMALKALSGLTSKSRRGKSRTNLSGLELWYSNGGAVSMKGLMNMKPDEQQKVLNYMQSLPLYKEVSAGGRDFVLVHGGLEGFSPSKPLEKYKRDELLWCRPKKGMKYYPDKFVVFGHTPTIFESHFTASVVPGKIYRKSGWADIDCGCVYGSDNLGCLCLDTMEEIYL